MFDRYNSLESNSVLYKVEHTKISTLEKVIQELKYKLDISIIHKRYAKARKYIQINQLMKKQSIEYNIK